MHTMQSRVGNVGEEPSWQFTLDVEVVLLQISVLLDGITGCRKVVLRQNVLRDVRLRVAPRDPNQGARTVLVEWSLPRTAKIGRAARRGQDASVLIERRAGRQAGIVAGEEVRRSAADRIDVRIRPE